VFLAGLTGLSIALGASAIACGQQATEAELVGHWPLIDHPRDVSPSKLASTANGIEFAKEEKSPGKNFGARFDGRKSFVEVSDARKLQLGKQPFSISLWAEVDDDFGDPLGDLISCYDSKERRGFHLGIYSHGGVTNSQPNSRQVHFGIDHAKVESEFADHGRLGDAVYVFSLCVHNGRLYASTCHAGANQSGRVFRWEGAQRWTPCSTPDGKRVEALTVFNDALYATSYDEGSVFRFDGQDWKLVGVIPEATQTYGIGIHQGNLYVSEWPKAHVFRYRGESDWVDTGKLGQELEAMPLLVYNGKMYGGTLPLAEIYRYDGDENWTRFGRVDTTPEVKYRRAWSMAVFQGRLFVGTLPSGRVLSIETGRNATNDRANRAGWHHIAAVRGENALKLYIDGMLVSESSGMKSEDYDLSIDSPLRIGFGAQDYFRGRITDVRLYRGELTAPEIESKAALNPIDALRHE
jgi:hypothetical protein